MEPQDKTEDRQERPARPSSAPPGRWWFAFDRWFPVTEPEADEFVLA